jgi:hypothetical protein
MDHGAPDHLIHTCDQCGISVLSVPRLRTVPDRHLKQAHPGSNDEVVDCSVGRRLGWQATFQARCLKRFVERIDVRSNSIHIEVRERLTAHPSTASR